MELFIKKTIGKTIYNFVVEGKNLFELITESQKLSFNDVKSCGWCSSNDLFLNARTVEGFDYVEVKCNACHAALVFGQTKADKNTFYLRRNDDKTLAWKQAKDENKLAPIHLTKYSKQIAY